MLALPELQAAFARAVRGGAIDPALAALVLPDALRLNVHRNTARATAVEALRLSFPAVEAIVGAEAFAVAAARFWHAHPPRQAWLAGWGDAFPSYLARLRGARALPYLGDVARFEWALSEAAVAPEATPLDLAALAAVPAERQGELRFTPHPSLHLLRLRHPADAIADAVLADDEATMAGIDLAGGPVHLLVHRGAGGVAARRLAPAEFRALRKLFAGTPLWRVLAGARGLDAAALLAEQFATGRVVGATLAEVPS
jgi:hypothetical protein